MVAAAAGRGVPGAGFVAGPGGGVGSGVGGAVRSGAGARRGKIVTTPKGIPESRTRSPDVVWTTAPTKGMIMGVV